MKSLARITASLVYDSITISIICPYTWPVPDICVSLGANDFKLVCSWPSPCQLERRVYPSVFFLVLKARYRCDGGDEGGHGKDVVTVTADKLENHETAM